MEFHFHLNNDHAVNMKHKLTYHLCASDATVFAERLTKIMSTSTCSSSRLLRSSTIQPGDTIPVKY